MDKPIEYNRRAEDKINLPGKTVSLNYFGNDPSLDYAHKVMAESQERLEKIFTSVPVGILVIDAENHQIVDANPKALEMIGGRIEKVLGNVCHHFVCPSEKGQCPITDNNRHIDNSERKLLTLDGKTIPILKTVAMVGIGGRKHIIESFLDISDLKRTKQKLLESEKRYRDIFDNVSDMVHLISPDGFICYSNPAWEHVLGYSREEMTHFNITDIIAEQYRKSFMSTVARLSAKQKPGLVETVFMAKDGREVPVEGNINFQKENEVLTGIHLVWRDITARKNEEKQMELLNRKLEDMVEEKNRQLQDAQIKLLRAEKMATISGMAHGTAHELNNPVSGILCAVQVLRESKQLLLNDKETIKAAQWLEAIERAATRCVKIVNDLNVFSDHEKTTFLKTDIRHVMNKAAENLTEELLERRITLMHRPSPPLHKIDADPWQIEKLLTNVLHNATRAVPDGGRIEVELSLLNEIDAPKSVRISLRDNGCGIPKANLSKIFDPFFTTWAIEKGTGLGLTVCYGIIKRHHGDMDVFSEEGVGTEVVITLPCQQPDL